MIIKVNGVTIEDGCTEDHTPVDVAMWYDRRLRMWTLYPVDAYGNQLRQASYAPRKDLAQMLKEDIWEEIRTGNTENYYYTF